MIDERCLCVKDPGESKVELLQGGQGEGRGAEYATKHHIFNFVERKALKLF